MILIRVADDSYTITCFEAEFGPGIPVARTVTQNSDDGSSGPSSQGEFADAVTDTRAVGG